MAEDELAALLEKARNRDPDALAALCARFYPRVVNYMRYRVRPEVAEDLAGDVFLRVLRNIDRQTGHFQAWLFRIASNVVADHHQNASREKAVKETMKAETPSSEPEQRPAEAMDIERALTGLKNDEREVIVLRFMEGLSSPEVGEAMNRSPGAIRILQYRAMQSLRSALARGGNTR